MRKSSRYAAYLPFVLVAVIGLVYHVGMKPMAGDDIFFRDATKDTMLWAYLTQRYLTWTSRVVSECVLVNVIQCPVLWRIIDFLLFATLPLLLSGLFGGGKMMNWCAAAAVLIFPFHDMGTAGWITTTVTHFWPFWGFFYVAWVIRKLALAEKIHPAAAVSAVPVAVVTGSHEQYAVIMTLLLVLSGVYLWKAHRRPGNAVLFWTLAVIDVVSLLVIALCPGNAGRNAVSIADLPVYATFGFGQKLYLGLLSIERVFIANADIVFFLVVLIWTWLVWEKTKDYRRTFLSALPLLILFGQTVNCISGALGAVRDAGGDSGVELERSVDVDSYGVSGSDGGSDDLCAVPAVRRRSVYLHQRAASGGVRLWCRDGAGLYGDDLRLGRARVCAAVRDSSGGHTVWHLPAAQRVEGAGGCGGIWTESRAGGGCGRDCGGFQSGSAVCSVPDGADSCLLCGERIVYRFVIVRPEV